MSTPQVVIDARMIGGVPHGIARYVLQLAHGLRLLQEKERLPYYPVFMVAPGAPTSGFEPFKTISVSAPFLHPKEIFDIPSILKKTRADLYHSPSFASLWNCPCPSLITIHDLNHLTFGNWSQKVYYRTLLRRFALKSKTIITVSEFSRQELSKWLGIPDSQIEVVTNSLDHPVSTDASLSQNVLAKVRLESKKYFFCLSNPKPHKNLPFLIKAYQTFRTQQKNAWPLVLTVDSSFSSESGIYAIGPKSEAEVSALLSHTGGALFPSLYEGFGLPPVEAALSQVSLAVSRIPPHVEGLADLQPYEALWINPTDHHGWVNAFHRLSQGEIQPPSLASRQKILERFHPARMGVAMDRIYRNALKP